MSVKASSPHVRVTHSWQSSTCVVDVEPLETLDEIAALFPRSIVSATATGDADVRVERTGAGITVTPGDPELHTRSCDAVSATEHAITMHFLRGDVRHTHLHAAAALAEGGAVLAMGRSGAGKSTLAFTWSQMGIPIFGDDVLPMDGNGLVYTFPRLLKVDTELYRASGRAPEETLAWDEEADDVWGDPEPLGGWAEGAAPIAVLAEITYRPGAALRVEEVRGGEGLRLLLNSVQMTGLTREDSLDRLIALAEEHPVYRVESGDAAEAAERLLRMAGDARVR